MESNIKAILSANDESIEKILDDFIKNTTPIFNFPELSENDRYELWNNLYERATKADHTLLIKIFSVIRILSREKNSLSKLVTDEWLDLLKKHTGLYDGFEFSKENELVAIEAQKCLCNIVFNSLHTANKCCKNGILDNIVKRISTYRDSYIPHEVTFFDLKLLFLLSALCPQIRKSLREDNNVDTLLIKVLEKSLSEAYKNKSETNVNGILNNDEVDMICELLKALFNLTLHLNENLDKYKHLTDLLRQYLLVSTSNIEKANLLHNNIVNLLTNMPPETLEALTVFVDNDNELILKDRQYDGRDMSAIYEILNLLKYKFNEEFTTPVQHELLSPILTVLLKGADSVRSIRKYLKLCILPPLKDVHNRPEEGSTLRNHLCRLLTTPITQLRDITAELLFTLCKKNVKRMIKYTGYGNAAGLFAQRGLLGGRRDEGEADYSSDSGDSETEEYAEYKHAINPVLGCYEKPHPNPMQNMSEEQKEYEAMKLVQLMNDLTKCQTVRPCRVGKDGKPEPIEHVLQLQEGINIHNANNDSDSD